MTEDADIKLFGVVCTLLLLLRAIANFKTCSRGPLGFIFDFLSIFLLCCHSTREAKKMTHSYVYHLLRFTELLKLNLAV